MSSRRDLSSLHSTTQLSDLPRCGTVTVCAINNKCPVAIIVFRPSLCLDYSFPLFFHVLCSFRHENRDPGTSRVITAPDPDHRPEPEYRILAMGSSGTNTREAFAALFQPAHPNIAWAIRQATTAYPLEFSIATAYELLSQQVPDFTRSLEAGLQSLYDNNKTPRNELQELKSQNEHLKSHSESLQALNTIQADTITALKLARNNNATAGGAAPAAPKKKRESKDPDKYAGKGSPTERQQDFEIWISKIRSVFARDSTYFDTAVSQILHIGDLLEGKAYEYISDGINKMLSNPTNPANWQWQDREGLLQHLSTHYVTLDTTQTAKHKLDDFRQTARNYWSWKAELDEAMTRAKKTEEQKVDLLRKWINPKMKGLVTGLPHIIPDDDYDAWSK